MKKFAKIVLIIAGILTIVGSVCLLLAFAFGMTADHFAKMIQDGKFSIDEGDFHISYENDWKDESDEDLHHGEYGIHEIDKTCKNLDIEFGAGIFEIYYDDVESIQVKQNDIQNLKVQVKNDTLVISEGAHVDLYVTDDRRLTVILPKEMQFEDVSLEIGASKANVKDVYADCLEITVGAGQADISNIISKEFELEVGAGQATVTKLTSDRIDVDAGLGEVNVELNGVQEEYNYTVECGVGSVVVGDSEYNGLGASQKIEHDGATKQLDVECGIGEVRIRFTE